MARSVVLTIVTMILAAAGSVFAQTPTPTPRPLVNRTDILKSPEDSDDNEESRPLRGLRSEDLVSAEAYRRVKFTKDEKAQYKPATRSGEKLLKIYIAPDCATKLVVDVSDPRCTENFLLFAVSYFSFFVGDYGQQFGELQMSGDSLIGGRDLYRQGMLLDLGDRDIGSLNKQSPEVVALSSFKIAKTVDTATKQRDDLEKAGIEVGGLRLTSKRKISPKNSYLFRFISYSRSEWVGLPQSYDSIIALRIDRLTTDGFAVVLWKRLSQKTAPRLKPDRTDGKKTM